MKRLAVVLAATLLVALCPLALPAEEEPATPPAADMALHLSDVFVSSTGDYHTYRIPSLLVTPKGTLLAFCEG